MDILSEIQNDLKEFKKNKLLGPIERKGLDIAIEQIERYKTGALKPKKHNCDNDGHVAIGVPLSQGAICRYCQKKMW